MIDLGDCFFFFWVGAEGGRRGFWISVFGN